MGINQLSPHIGLSRTVATKFAKSFRTVFMPVCDGALGIVTDWIGELCVQHLWVPDDPLFPATAMGLDEAGGFHPQGLARHGWASSGPIRDLFRRAFEGAGLPYYNPHSFRDMLVRHAMTLDLTPEEMKAWSQNLGQSDVLTTFASYGTVSLHRQAELIRSQRPNHPRPVKADTIAPWISVPSLRTSTLTDIRCASFAGPKAGA